MFPPLVCRNRLKVLSPDPAPCANPAASLSLAYPTLLLLCVAISSSPDLCHNPAVCGNPSRCVAYRRLWPVPLRCVASPDLRVISLLYAACRPYSMISHAVEPSSFASAYFSLPLTIYEIYEARRSYTPSIIKGKPSRPRVPPLSPVLSTSSPPTGGKGSSPWRGLPPQRGSPSPSSLLLTPFRTEQLGGFQIDQQ
ncbi:hypothetical protein DFH07DRAFT_846637 [Mycena maculata]|uniref:Uncharacterized protein n=1 Tax=Mycena maculata TaxID=230809 RepID=A0AAD7I266_9AGAR|nr:hypothetical protein DFH07DRAFT_846637 [Mycena maculata]